MIDRSTSLLDRRGTECWILIFDLDDTRTSATKCLRGDQLPRKDHQGDAIAENIDEVETQNAEILDNTEDLEEWNYGLVGICVANLIAAIVNSITMCRRNRSPTEESAPSRYARDITREGEPKERKTERSYGRPLWNELE